MYYFLFGPDDGGAVAAALSCASLALADAGIELYDLVAACTAVRAWVQQPSHVLLFTINVC